MNKIFLFIFVIVFFCCSRKSATTIQENKILQEEAEYQFDCSSSAIDSSSRPLTRKIINRPNFTSFAGDNPFKIAYHVCINQEGELTAIKFASADGIKDTETIQRITRKLRELRFKTDYNAPRKECGTYTIKISAVEFQLR
jgi:hypothetical protein